MAGYPDLTRAEMFEDFDAFENIVRDVLPTAVANKKIFGIDVFSRLKHHRSRISRVKRTPSFVSLIDQAMNSCKASHFSMSSIRVEEYRRNANLREYIREHVDEESIAIHFEYQEFLRKRNAKTRLNIPLFYHDGQYYTKHDFSYNGEHFEKGLRVDACNGETPDGIVERIAEKYARLPWDSRRSKFYAHWFYRDRSVPKDGKLTVEFVDRDGNRMKVVFQANNTVEYREPKQIPRIVKFLKPWNILYIRIPSMDQKDTPYYTSGIQRAKNEDLEAVVIDIRNNSGGSDDVWWKIISQLTDEKLEFILRLGARNTELNLSYLTRHPFGAEIARNGKPERIPYLKGEEFLVLTKRMELEPAENTIHHGGPIYVLSDAVFSAAGSLVTFAKQIRNITSVGLKNPYILGMGIDPYIFTLPNSKFIFRIEPIIDLTNCRTAEDIYHTDVEVQIHPSIDEMLNYYNCPTRTALKEFLADHDPFFRKVLELVEI